MSVIDLDEPGKELLMMGNEAIARGALEAGAKVCTAYPGTPSSEIIASLSEVANKMDLYVEWSVNEKVALEAAAAAAFTGLRSICAMKQNGLNVASDFLTALSKTGVPAGMVLVTCDDPGAHSSGNEEDSRAFAKIAELPLLEPATFQEAKEMTKWAFTLSEEIESVCMLRGVTRISHARGNVTLDELLKREVTPHFDTIKGRQKGPVVEKHRLALETLKRVEEIFEDSPFNEYSGPATPEVLIVTCGSGWLYSREAIELLHLEEFVGILKVGTTWPLPRRLILENLEKTDQILFVEEINEFLEGHVKEIAADYARQIGIKSFFGKRSGHIPNVGEMNSDHVIQALKQIISVEIDTRDEAYVSRAAEWTAKMVPSRELGFCPGCPHRASFWNIKHALELDGRDGFVVGDIGCYALSRGPAGYFLSKTSAAMGSATGMASGFGKLERFGFEQPVISMCGDSTFFHAAIPALVNARYNQSNFIMVILDNSATAMTGFQPNPGVGTTAMGDAVPPMDIEEVCRSFGAKVIVADPFDLVGTQAKLLDALEDPDGTKVLIMRRKCALLRLKDEKPPYKVSVDEQHCLGENCGCNRFCTRAFKCPGLVWDKEAGKSKVDEVICIGCGVCADICPEGAIIREEAV
jgi:indolepyruvate ferredoxin oxidoreductase alpha subunit